MFARITFSTLTALTIVGLCATNFANASFTFNEDFEGATVGPGLPAGWVETNGDFEIVSPGPGLTPPTNKAAQLSTTVTGVEQATYTGLSDDNVDSSLWLDYDLTARLSAGNWSDTTSLWWGMGVRLQSDGSMLGFRIRGNTGTFGNAIQIIRVTDTGGIVTLATSASTSNVNANEYVDIEFTVTNDDINNEIDIFAQMTTEAGPTTRDVSYSLAYSSPNAITTAGELTLIANASSFDFTWDDIVVTGTAVPEPASMALLGLGGLMMLLRRRA